MIEDVVDREGEIFKLEVFSHFENPYLLSNELLHNSTLPSPFGFLKNMQGCRKGEKVKGIHDLKLYLSHFGYLNYQNDTNPDIDHFDDELEAAVKSYQVYYHLNVTGALDEPTVSRMFLLLSPFVLGLIETHFCDKDLRSHRIHFALTIILLCHRHHYRLACAKPPGTLLLPQLPGGLLLPPPLTGCHRDAYRRLLLTQLNGVFFLPPLTGPLLLPLLTGPLLLPPLTTSCSLVVVCFSKAAAVHSGEKTMQYGESIDDGENTHGQLPRLLDIVLYLCENEHIEGEMIFQLLEDLTEMSTMKNCEDVFGYIESKQYILGKPELFAREKLVMLRTCNQLLRRLSKVFYSNVQNTLQ
ncbi:hypothetical protein R6Q57_007035 [Mikania cordata]